MPALSNIQKSQCRFHLLYNTATPAGDRARIERAMNEIPDDWTVGRIGELISRCEDAHDQTQLEEGDLVADEEVAITGDVIRTTQAKNRATWNKRQRYYLHETNTLARSLGVRNYRDLDQALAGYLVDGGTYINSIPGVKGDPGSISAATGIVLQWSEAPLTGANQTALFIDIADGVLKIRAPNNGEVNAV